MYIEFIYFYSAFNISYLCVTLIVFTYSYGSRFPIVLARGMCSALISHHSLGITSKFTIAEMVLVSATHVDIFVSSS